MFKSLESLVHLKYLKNLDKLTYSQLKDEIEQVSNHQCKITNEKLKFDLSEENLLKV